MEIIFHDRYNLSNSVLLRGEQLTLSEPEVLALDQNVRSENHSNPLQQSTQMFKSEVSNSVDTSNKNRMISDLITEFCIKLTEYIM